MSYTMVMLNKLKENRAKDEVVYGSWCKNTLDALK